MTKWRKRIVLRDIIHQYNSNAKDEFQEVKRIKLLFIDRLQSIPELDIFIDKLKYVKTEAAMNKWLNQIYDFCDMERIWIEL